MAFSMSSVPCAMSPMSSLMARFHPAMVLPARPSGSLWQRKVRCFNSGSRRSAAMAVTSLNVEPGGYSP